jgi:hypothetical protein
MAFDSNKPANNSPISSAELRAQLAALKELIDQRPTMDAVLQAIDQHAAKPCPTVQELELTIFNPPSQVQVQAIADKIDEMLFHLKQT